MYYYFLSGVLWDSWGKQLSSSEGAAGEAEGDQCAEEEAGGEGAGHPAAGEEHQVSGRRIGRSIPGLCLTEPFPGGLTDVLVLQWREREPGVSLWAVGAGQREQRWGGRGVICCRGGSGHRWWTRVNDRHGAVSSNGEDEEEKTIKWWINYFKNYNI